MYFAAQALHLVFRDLYTGRLRTKKLYLILSVSSFEMYNLEENKIYLENIELHLRCNAEKVIYNS